MATAPPDEDQHQCDRDGRRSGPSECGTGRRSEATDHVNHGTYPAPYWPCSLKTPRPPNIAPAVIAIRRSKRFAPLNLGSVGTLPQEIPVGGGLRRLGVASLRAQHSVASGVCFCGTPAQVDETLLGRSAEVTDERAVLASEHSPCLTVVMHTEQHATKPTLLSVSRHGAHGRALMRDTVGIDSAYFAAFPRVLALTAATDRPDYLAVRQRYCPRPRRRIRSDRLMRRCCSTPPLSVSPPQRDDVSCEPCSCTALSSRRFGRPWSGTAPHRGRRQVGLRRRGPR